MASEPQGTPTGMRAEEIGKSECRPVMGWIRVAAQAYITRPEKGQTSDGSFLTRKLEEPRKEEKQMNAKNKNLACASSDGEMQWHQIDWSQAHRNVRRLQARIVKATKQGRWGKVKALQWLLTHSLSGKAIAVKQVTENQGKKTPGVDGETWSTPEAKTAAVKSLKRRGYQPKPLRRVYIPKPNGKKRPLGIPTMRDRAMQALYLLALDPVSETLADRNSYGFRKGRSTHDAIEQCFTVLGKGKSPKWVLEGDIQGCFDNISHEWMEANIPMDKAILRKWLKAGVIEKGKLFATEEGTPQGGIISPTLANIVLDGLEEQLRNTLRPKRIKGKIINPMINLVRYADDFIIIGSTPDVLERAKNVTHEFLQERGLSLSEEKTKIVHIETGFDFLGQNVRMYGGKLLIKPSKNAVKRLLTKIRRTIQKNKTTSQERLIGQLNPIIRGWVNYHRFSVASKTFSRIDHNVWQALWRWATRRHNKKGALWVRTRYFHTISDRTWAFASKTVTVDGRQWTKLVHAADTKIKRFRKIKAEANPYDPDWEIYFEERLKLRMGLELLASRNAWRLWQNQNGLCPECRELITPKTGWHVHHVVYRVHGGKNILSNLRLIHPNCHRKLHHNNPSQSLPGSSMTSL
jgi:RNA-directed DNA polymerase